MNDRNRPMTSGRCPSASRSAAGPNWPLRNYDVFPDGSFAFHVEDDDMGAVNSPMSASSSFGATELHVILNWVEELKERVPN